MCELATEYHAPMQGHFENHPALKDARALHILTVDLLHYGLLFASSVTMFMIVLYGGTPLYDGILLAGLPHLSGDRFWSSTGY